MPSDKIPRSRLERHLSRLALTVLEPLGFHAEDHGCLRAFEGGTQYVAVSVTDTGGRNSINPFAFIGLIAPGEIKQRFLGTIGRYGAGIDVPYGHFSGDPIHGRQCQSSIDLEEANQWFRQFLLEELVPCLERHSTPMAILAAYLEHDETEKNTTDVLAWKGWHSAATGLIYARLYGPQHYAALKQRYARVFAPLLPEFRQSVERLVAWLDQSTLDERV